MGLVGGEEGLLAFSALTSCCWGETCLLWGLLGCRCRPFSGCRLYIHLLGLLAGLAG